MLKPENLPAGWVYGEIHGFSKISQNEKIYKKNPELEAALKGLPPHIPPKAQRVN